MCVVFLLVFTGPLTLTTAVDHRSLRLESSNVHRKQDQPFQMIHSCKHSLDGATAATQYAPL